MSMAMMASMPLRLRVSTRVPYCGRASAMTRNMMESCKNQNLSSVLSGETSFMRGFSNSGSPYRLRLRLFL